MRSQVLGVLLLGASLVAGCSQQAIGAGSTGSAASSAGIGAAGNNGAGNNGVGNNNGAGTNAAGNTGTTGTSATSATNVATGTTGASGSTGTGTTGTPACGGSATPGPTLACTSPQSGTSVLAGQTVEIDCTIGSSNVSWGLATSLGGATIQNRLTAAAPVAYVTFEGTGLPVNFADTTVTVTVSAADCSRESVASQATVSFTLVGNTLASNYEGGTIDAYTSDGALRGNFIGPGMLNDPGLVAVLADGSILAGGVPDSSHPGLLHVDKNGNPLSGWDSTDHTNTPLWNSSVVPYGAAQDAMGNVWVTGPGQYGQTPGVIHIFNSAGAYQNDAQLPTDLEGSSLPFGAQGIVMLSSGDMIVADAAYNTPYVVRYPSAGGLPYHVPLTFEVCSDNGTGTPVTCEANSTYPFGNTVALTEVSAGLLVTIDNGDEGMVGLFDGELRFLLATAQPASASMVDRGYYNTIFSAITVSGNVYVASPGYTGCLYSVSQRTLFDPNPTAEDATCWSTSEGDVGARGLAHLGPS